VLDEIALHVTRGVRLGRTGDAAPDAAVGDDPVAAIRHVVTIAHGVARVRAFRRSSSASSDVSQTGIAEDRGMPALDVLALLPPPDLPPCR
jgi:hypothetical protein